MSSNSTVKLVLFDLDGTLYLDGVLLPGVTAFLDRLDTAGIPYAFMTNNSSVGPDGYLTKLQNIGLAATAENILTSAEATTLMLADLKLGPKLFVLGTAAFRAYLAQQGYPHDDENPAAVLVGFDKELDFARLTAAVRYLEQGLPLVASHPDVCCPSAEGPLPDAGVILAALKTATAAEPLGIAGKPHRWIVQLAQTRFNVQPDEIMVVGDRLHTDIHMGVQFGMRAVLTLTGVTRREELTDSDIQPDLVVSSVADLADKHWPGDLGWF